MAETLQTTTATITIMIEQIVGKVFKLLESDIRVIVMKLVQ